DVRGARQGGGGGAAARESGGDAEAARHMGRGSGRRGGSRGSRGLSSVHSADARSETRDGTAGERSFLACRERAGISRRRCGGPRPTRGRVGSGNRSRRGDGGPGIVGRARKRKRAGGPAVGARDRDGCVSRTCPRKDRWRREGEGTGAGDGRPTSARL